MKGIGIDMESVARFEHKLDDREFLNRIFNQAELTYCFSKHNPAVNLTGYFCAKEAIVKAFHSAFGEGAIALCDIEISHNAQGVPQAIVRSNFSFEVRLSISHTTDSAIAIALIL